MRNIRRIFDFDESSLNSSSSAGTNPSNTNSQSTTTISDYSLQSSDTRDSYGIYEEHPGLNPTTEDVVYGNASLFEKFQQLLPNNSEEDAGAAAEHAHGESNDPSFLENMLNDLNQNGRASETFQDAVNSAGITVSPCDAAEPWQLGFQDAATPMMQGIIDLHHDIFFFLILILVFVLWILVRALWHFHYKKNPIPQRIVHGTTIEILWTIFPSIILMFIAIPSFALLYSMDEVVVDPAITIKAIGHQWYWTYEYSDYNSSDEQSLTFDSYMIPEDDLELGQSRLLEVDNRVVVPAKTFLRIILTSADVLHSWAVPSLGVKCDAVPGRLNQISILVQREGVYYGQCSEICGTNHAFMPIVVEAVSRKDYGYWVSNQLIP